MLLILPVIKMDGGSGFGLSNTLNVTILIFKFRVYGNYTSAAGGHLISDVRSRYQDLGVAGICSTTAIPEFVIPLVGVPCCSFQARAVEQSAPAATPDLLAAS